MSFGSPKPWFEVEGMRLCKTYLKRKRWFKEKFREKQMELPPKQLEVKVAEGPTLLSESITSWTTQDKQN